MKKLLVIVLSLVLCITCVNFCYAEDKEVEEKEIKQYSTDRFYNMIKGDQDFKIIMEDEYGYAFVPATDDREKFFNKLNQYKSQGLFNTSKSFWDVGQGQAQGHMITSVVDSTAEGTYYYWDTIDDWDGDSHGQWYGASNADNIKCETTLSMTYIECSGVSFSAPGDVSIGTTKAESVSSVDYDDTYYITYNFYNVSGSGSVLSITQLQHKAKITYQFGSDFYAVNASDTTGWGL
jgi:hypothetical protein